MVMLLCNALQALAFLDICGEDNVVFTGDLNWQPADGPLPLPEGWCALTLRLMTTNRNL